MNPRHHLQLRFFCCKLVVITVFFVFFTHDYIPTILTNKKAATFGSSELSGRTAPGLLLATWGGSFAIGDAAPDVFIPYGAP